jgi:hypothetical protein
MKKVKSLIIGREPSASDYIEAKMIQLYKISVLKVRLGILNVIR